MSLVKVLIAMGGQRRPERLRRPGRPVGRPNHSDGIAGARARQSRGELLPHAARDQVGTAIAG